MSDNEELNIMFLAPTSSQPRYHKRVNQLMKFGTVHVYAFTRDYYNENSFPPNAEYNSLGKIKDGKYLHRITRFIKAILIVFKARLKHRKCIYYALSFDCLIIAKICGIKTGYYEIGDLRITKQRKGFLTILEAYLLKRVSGLVLTSRYFYDEFYCNKKIIPADSVYIIDNKLNKSFQNCRPKINLEESIRIRIGLIGLLRYKKPIELLLNYVKNRPSNYIIECYGDGPCATLVKQYSSENIRFHGSFKNPDDLKRIYNSVDLSYVVYDNDSLNVRLAIPNKLFESAYFGVPIICGSNTALLEEVKKMGIGKSICTKSSNSFQKDLESISRAKILEYKKNCSKIVESDLIESGDEVVKSMLLKENLI